MNKTRLYLGVLLILIGVVTLVGMLTHVDDGKLFGAGLFAAVGAFLFLAFMQTHKIGFLISGCNTLAMGLFIALTLIPGFEQRGNLAGAGFFATQGLAFAAMYLLGVRKPWPLMVATWLAAFALFVAFFAESALPGSVVGAAFFVLMGLGFLALKLWGVTGQWPVITGLAAILFGLCLPLLSGEIVWFRGALIRRVLLPALLIGAGVVMMFFRKGTPEPPGK